MKQHVSVEQIKELELLDVTLCGTLQGPLTLYTEYSELFTIGKMIEILKPYYTKIDLDLNSENKKIWTVVLFNYVGGIWKVCKVLIEVELADALFEAVKYVLKEVE